MKSNLILTLFLATVFNGFSQADSTYIKELLDIGYQYESTNPDSAIITYNKAYDIAKKIELPFFAGKSNQYKGIVYSDMGEYDSAVYYYEKSKEYFAKINNDKVIADVNVNIGNVYNLQGDFVKTVEYYLDALNMYDSINETTNALIVYGNLALVFEKIERLDEAKSYYNKSIELADKIQDSTQLINNYYNLSILYQKEGKNDSVLIALNRGRQFLSKNSDLHLRFILDYGESEYFLEKKNYQKSYERAKLALELEKQINNPYYLANSHILLAKSEFFLNRLDAAEKNVLHAIELAALNKEVLMVANNVLADIYKAKNNHVQALDRKEIYFKYYDSIMNERQRNTINTLNLRYETEKKDKELAEQKLAIEETELELQKRKTQYSIMTGITIFLFVFSLLGWFLYQQRQKRKNQEILTLKREQQVKTLESLMEGEEKERFRIAKELHDGVNGDLSAIKYKLTSMLEYNTAIVNDVVAMIDKSSEQVRAISHNLVPPSLEKFNLVEALEDYCTTMNEVHPAAVTYQHLGEQVAISKNNEINIYRIVQELVSNGIKHSGADIITVQTSNRENIIQLTVEDNGSGFNLEEVHKKGIGLQNIDSRIDYLNATKDFISNSKGTSYTIEIDTSKLNDN